MQRFLSSVSLAALVGFLICGVVLAGIWAEFGSAVVLGTRVGHLTLGLGTVFVLVFPLVLLVDRHATPRHLRIYERARGKPHDRLSPTERKCVYALEAQRAIASDGLHEGVRRLGEVRARRAVDAFARIGLPRLARMFADYLDALERGDFSRRNGVERAHYRETCKALTIRMNSAGLARIPEILDDAL